MSSVTAKFCDICGKSEGEWQYFACWKNTKCFSTKIILLFFAGKETANSSEQTDFQIPQGWCKQQHKSSKCVKYGCVGHCSEA